MTKPTALTRRLIHLAARRYLAADRFAWHFARGKLRGDPIFVALLAHGLIPDRARILDLGCGQGLLAAWLDAARGCHDAGDWCAAWPPPPADWSYRGIEIRPRDVERARRALSAAADVTVGDIRSAGYGNADVVALFDVLHYLDPGSQVKEILRIRAALSPAGVLLLRIGDAGAGLPFRFSNWVDRVVCLLRGQGWVRLHCRSLQGWLDLLAGLGYLTHPVSMSADTPFANMLLVARTR